MKILMTMLFLTHTAAYADTLPEVRHLPPNPNQIYGSCKDLRANAASGVRDTSGNVHSGACGFTQFIPLFDNLILEQYVDEIADKKPIEAIPYTDASGAKCLRADGFKVELSGSTEVSYLNWNHNKPSGSKCADAWSKLKKIIIDHENKHVEDAQTVLNSAQKRLQSMHVSYCAKTSNENPEMGLLEKAFIEFKNTALALKEEWSKLENARDHEGDLCDINCCECSDTSCYAGSFNADSTSDAGISYKGAQGKHIEMSLIREDRDSKGRLLQQFYTIDRGEFEYPAMVSMGEFDCTLNKRTFHLAPSEANMTIFYNNPNFSKNSYNLGFFTNEGPVGNCYLRSNPRVSFTMPLVPFAFSFLSECSHYNQLPIEIPGVLEGQFTNTCAGTNITLDWNLKEGTPDK